MPSLTVREYHPETGTLLNNISVLDFGKVTAGSHSRVKVIDIAFQEITQVSNIKIGIIASGGITVNNAGIGHFGITSSQDFNASLTASPLSSHFLGANTTGTSADLNNISIGNRNGTLSNYIYLDIELGTTNVTGGNGAYKLFFDYA